jgi:threonine synthase
LQIEESKFVELRCISCGKSYPPDTHSTCAACDGILSADYHLDKAIDLSRRESMWQFREYLPPVEAPNVVSMGEGWTPLIKLENFAGKIGLSSNNLMCKMEGQNPSGSFKDRAASLLVSLAREWKKKGIFLASSGNAAAATAAYCARGGINCLVLFRDDSTYSKLAQIAMYGPYLVRVKDLFKNTDTLLRALQLTQEALPDWTNGFIWAKYNPLLLDALKTISYEIASSGSTPDYVFVPTAGGDLIFGLYKGFFELKALGQIKEIPRMVVVQGLSPSPTVDAVEETKQNQLGKDNDSTTIAGALRSNMISPHGVVAVRKTNGFGVRVSNSEILEAHNLVAKIDGVFCEISSATALAAIAKSARDGRIEQDETVCAIATGSGFKDFHPPFSDVSQIPLADSSESIKPVLRKMFER